MSPLKQKRPRNMVGNKLTRDAALIVNQLQSSRLAEATKHLCEAIFLHDNQDLAYRKLVKLISLTTKYELGLTRLEQELKAL